MNFSFYIAKKYLFKKKSNNVVNIISGIAVFGVTTGAVALVIILSVFNGFEGLVTSLYKSFDPDIKITSLKGKTFIVDTTIVNLLDKTDNVLFYSQIIEEKALLQHQKKQYTAIIKGVDSVFNQTSNIGSTIKKGHYSFHSLNRCVLGVGVANALAIGIEDDSKTPAFNPTLEVYIPKRGLSLSINPEDAFNKGRLSPVGVFSIQAEIDEKYVITSFSFLQKLLNYELDEATSIEVAIKNKDKLFEVKEVLQQKLGKDFIVQTQIEMHESLFKMMKTEKLAVFIIFSFILIIATFNMVGAIVMLILDKKKDILTLTYLGADKNSIQKIYFYNGFMGILIGGVIGVVLGGMVSLIQEKFQIIKLPKGFVVDYYPIDLQLVDMVFVLSIILSVGALMAYLPTLALKTKS